MFVAQTLYPIVGSLTNDEIKNKVWQIFEKFVSDVEPAPLSDWMIQENIITSNRLLAIRHENPTPRDHCQALLNHFFSSQHPRAFLFLREALSKENHHFLEVIDNQEPQHGFRERPYNEAIVQG